MPLPPFLYLLVVMKSASLRRKVQWYDSQLSYACMYFSLVICVQHIPVCSTADAMLEGDVIQRVWKGVEELTVKFLNDIPTEWMYGGSGMNGGNIISWANEWSLRGGSTVPVFTLVEKTYGHSHIRVMFTSKTK